MQHRMGSQEYRSCRWISQPLAAKAKVSCTLRPLTVVKSPSEVAPAPVPKEEEEKEEEEEEEEEEVVGPKKQM